VEEAVLSLLTLHARKRRKGKSFCRTLKRRKRKESKEIITK